MQSVRFRVDDLFPILKEWKELRDIGVAMSTFGTVEIVQAFKQTELMNREIIQNFIHDFDVDDQLYFFSEIQNLTLHLASVNNIRNLERTNNVNKAAMDAVILTASKLQSFRLSDFQGHIFLTRVAPFLQNLTVEKQNFDELSETGSTVARNLKIKL
ncbi:hypothetical protein Fcan01_13697 [Folsomia candida]|uniref:Uncharacterized protein n=1 Tax=Folsomia candida TaxID=158441 RepID=A0A226E0T9_FOLCA|nr:hypothetical protein Fcan01_13697 [Folsomia candida]